MSAASAPTHASAAVPAVRARSWAWRWLGPAALVILVWRAGPQAIAGAWSGAHAGWLAAAAAVNLVILLLKTRRWLGLLAAQGIACPFLRGLRHYTIGAALGAWTPGRLGDFSKGIAVQRETGAGLTRTLSSVLADRLLDAAALACVVVMGAFRWDARWGAALALVAAASAAGAIALARRGAVSRRVPEAVRDAVAGLRSLGPGGWGWILAATAAATLATFLQAFLVARALGLPVGFADVAIAMSVASLASLLPVSVAGFGTREASVALVLAPSGITMPQVIGFCLAHVAVTGGALALLGAVAWVLPARVAPSSPASSRGWTAGRRVP